MLLNLVILVFSVVVFDMAHQVISFKFGVAKEYVTAKGHSALLTIPDHYPWWDRIQMGFSRSGGQ